MAGHHSVPLSSLERDGRTLVELEGRHVALFRVDGKVHAFENACPHEGNPLIEGEVTGGTLRCVYHLWRFDLDTGACLFGEAPARRYETKIVGEEVVIQLD